MSEPPGASPGVEEPFPHLREMATSDPFAAHLGAELINPDPMCLQVALRIEAHHTNFMGLVHGGAVYSLADIALSLISNAEVEAVALGTHLVQAASARIGDRLVATARPATRSRSVATYQITVERGDGKTIGMFTGTVFHRGDRPAGQAR
ncbi:MAG: hotdog fold thioesterase [bacterium]|nr:hotdog fold thioesterase [Acidimicrobiia bacterium]MCY4651469.1 hotdog fold thioesterase [bacterium]